MWHSRLCRFLTDCFFLSFCGNADSTWHPECYRGMAETHSEKYLTLALKNEGITKRMGCCVAIRKFETSMKWRFFWHLTCKKCPFTFLVVYIEDVKRKPFWKTKNTSFALFSHQFIPLFWCFLILCAKQMQLAAHRLVFVILQSASII